MQAHAPISIIETRSLLVVPFTILPEAFITTPFLSHGERGILTFLLGKGDAKRGGEGVSFSKQWVHDSLDSKYNVNKVWKRLIERGFIEKKVLHNAVTGFWGAKYVVHLNPQLLVEYTPKKRERTVRVLDEDALDTILMRFELREIDRIAAKKAIASVRKVSMRMENLTAMQPVETVEMTAMPVQAKEQAVEPLLRIAELSQLWDLHTEHKDRMMSNEVLVLQMQEKCKAKGFEFSEQMFVHFEHNLRIIKKRDKPYKSYDRYFNHFFDFMGDFNPVKKTGGQNLRFNKAKKMAEKPLPHISEEIWTTCVLNLIAFELKANEGLLSDGDEKFRNDLRMSRDNGTLSELYLKNGGKMPSKALPKNTASQPKVSTDATPVPASAKRKPRVEIQNGRITVLDFTDSYEDIQPMFMSLCGLLEKGKIDLAMFIGFLNNAFLYFEKIGKKTLYLRLKMLLETALEKPMYDTLERAKADFEKGILSIDQYAEKVKALEVWNHARRDDALKKMIT